MNFKILIIVTLSLIFKSCLFSNCKRINLTREEESWFNTYKENQKILFKSNSENIDTFLVTQIYNDYSPCNKVELSKNQYQEKLVRLISKKNKHEIISMEFSKKFQDSIKLNCKKYFRVFDMIAYYESENDSIVFKTIKIDKKEGKTYFFEVGKGNTSEFSHKIKSFNWSKEYGLVRYVTKKNEIFEFYKKEF